MLTLRNSHNKSNYKNMKKTFAFILLIVLAVFLTGCGITGNKNGGNRNNYSREFRRPDFGQPDSRPNITGLVKSIVGNEATVIKFELPEMGDSSEHAGGEEGEGEPSRTRPNAGMAFGAGGSGNYRVMHGQAGGSGGQSAMLERLKEMGGEEEKVIIPVGIRMLKFGADEGSDREILEATLSDIKANKMISIWLDENITDRNIATFVLITR